jgi:hypothetical protein
MTNTTDIIDAFKKHLDKRLNIKQICKEIGDLNSNFFMDIKNVRNVYSLVFKNINPDKKYVCDIDDFCGHTYDDYYEFNEDNENSHNDKNVKRKLFLNKDGFSVSDTFNVDDKKQVDISRTNYITSYESKQFIKILKRLFKYKNEIINSIVKPYKKSIAIRFFDAFEKSDCYKILRYNNDFNVYKEDFSPIKTIFSYDNDEIKEIKVKYLKFKNGNVLYIKSNNSDDTDNYVDSVTSIELNDIEKLSQIYDEVMTFLNNYFKYIKTQDKCLIEFYELLKNGFAKELILHALKDEEKK